MPLLLERIDRNALSTPPDTPVRDLLERARRKPARIYTWVVAPLPGGRYAVTRINEIALLAEELGATILDRTLEELPGLLRAGGAVQDSADLNTAEVQARSNPGQRIPVLDGEDVLGVLNLGPQYPSLPSVDPWRLEGVSPYQWPYDTLLLYDSYVILEGDAPVAELLEALEASEKGWIYLVVPHREGFYQVLAVDAALRDALREYRKRYPPLLIGDLPLPAPEPAVAEGAIPWEVVYERVLDTPARCLPVTRGGRVIGVLAELDRGMPTVEDWRRVLERHEGIEEEEEGEMAEEEEAAEAPPPPPPPPPPPAPGMPGEPAAAFPSFHTLFGRLFAPKPVPAGERPGDEPASSRFFNAGFFQEKKDTPLPPRQPLALDGGPYRLGVNAGASWGRVEKPEERFALDAKEGPLRHVLAGLKKEEALTLVVSVRPRAIGANLVRVAQPSQGGFGLMRLLRGQRSRFTQANQAQQELKLPKTGDGPLVFFDLAFEYPGRHALDVDLFYQGHLLQSLRVDLWVVANAGDPVPASYRQPDPRLTFSRIGTLRKKSLDAIKRPSTLTILVDRDGQIDLWFHVEGRTLGTERSHLSDASLQDLLERIRTALEEASKPYEQQIGGDREMLRLSLWQLASIGNEFYRALLPKVFDPAAPGSADDLKKLPLTHGQVIQVAALSTVPGVPWELLYQRPIAVFDVGNPTLVQLCPDFDTHSPEACPHDDPKIVCPHNFWGYRYIIEQLPNRVKPEQPPPLADLPLVIRNRRPLRFVPVVFEWPNLKNHLEELGGLEATYDLQLEKEIMAKADLETELTKQPDPADILYFYVHGGFDALGPMVELGPQLHKEQFRAGDLAAWQDKIDLSPRQTLVVFNACETATFLPEHHESLPQGFADRGASGVIGTQCKVYESFAAHFMRLFFGRLLAQQPVGQALFETRRELLGNCDPRGLIYSLLSSADVELAQPVIKVGGPSGGSGP